jgi:multisubunit Na+/H+ antiporter MnhB subunit
MTSVHRHPIVGFFAGLLLGLGLAIMLFIYGVLPISLIVLGALLVGGAVLGIVLAYIAPVRHKTAPA